MKKYLLFSLLAAASCGSPTAENSQTTDQTSTAAAAASPVIDEKNGFRELHFGQDLSTVEDLVAMPGRDYVAIKDYQKKPDKEKLQVGNAQIQDITYGFYKNKLVRVSLTALGDNTDKLLNAAIGLYGEPMQDKQVPAPGRAYWWVGEKVIGSYQETGREGKRGYLVLSDKAAAAEAEKAPANESGVADL
ncbi:hypothetical protein [Hymenobacter sp. DG01]|uniref:hypothetical protein n=1 Tax=Hymenobacter sp. DG01 TaxID=2584940 RepID=UPI001123016D|nr:hypothetical protein [Hymenobacter sp. DG01]